MADEEFPHTRRMRLLCFPILLWSRRSDIVHIPQPGSKVFTEK
jgi:hypothetical protein